MVGFSLSYKFLSSFTLGNDGWIRLRKTHYYLYASVHSCCRKLCTLVAKFCVFLFTENCALLIASYKGFRMAQYIANKSNYGYFRKMFASVFYLYTRQIRKLMKIIEEILPIRNLDDIRRNALGFR